MENASGSDVRSSASPQGPAAQRRAHRAEHPKKRTCATGLQKHSDFVIYRFLGRTEGGNSPEPRLRTEAWTRAAAPSCPCGRSAALPRPRPTFRTSSRLSSLAWSWRLSRTAASRSLVTAVTAWLSRAHSALTYKRADERTVCNRGSAALGTGPQLPSAPALSFLCGESAPPSSPVTDLMVDPPGLG